MGRAAERPSRQLSAGLHHLRPAGRGADSSCHLQHRRAERTAAECEMGTDAPAQQQLLVLHDGREAADRQHPADRPVQPQRPLLGGAVAARRRGGREQSVQLLPVGDEAAGPCRTADTGHRSGLRLLRQLWFGTARCTALERAGGRTGTAQGRAGIFPHRHPGAGPAGGSHRDPEHRQLQGGGGRAQPYRARARLRRPDRAVQPSGLLPGLRGAVREAQYSPSRGPDDDRPRQPQDYQRHLWPRLG